MQELLDQPLSLPSEQAPIPTILRVTGGLLLVFWTLFAYLEIELCYYLDYYKPATDGFIVGFALAVLTRYYKSTMVQDVVQQWRKLLPILLALTVMGYIISQEIGFLLRTLGKTGLVYGLSIIVITAYQTSPQAPRIWHWLRAMSNWWWVLMALYFLTAFVNDGLYQVFHGLLHPVLLVVFFFQTIQFYRKKTPTVNNYDSYPTAFFIVCVFIVLVGQFTHQSYSEYGRPLAALGIGLCLLTALYAWIKHTPTPPVK